MFSNSRVEVKEYYLDDTSLGAGRSEATVWSYSYIKDLSRRADLIIQTKSHKFLVNKFRTGQSFEGYPNVAHLVDEVVFPLYRDEYHLSFSRLQIL